MEKVIRLSVIAALILGAGVARADHDPYTANSPHPDDQAAAAQAPAPEGGLPGANAPAQAEVAKPAPGAGGMEPGEAIDEDPGSGVHRAWVESIWYGP